MEFFNIVSTLFMEFLVSLCQRVQSYLSFSHYPQKALCLLQTWMDTEYVLTFDKGNGHSKVKLLLAVL